MALVVPLPIAWLAYRTLVQPQAKAVAAGLTRRLVVERLLSAVVLEVAPQKAVSTSAVRQVESRLKLLAATPSFAAPVALVLPTARTVLSPQAVELELKQPPVDKPWREEVCEVQPTEPIRQFAQVEPLVLAMQPQQRGCGTRWLRRFVWLSSGRRRSARQNQWGYTAVNARAGYGVGGTGQVASRSAIRGPAGNVVSGGRGASYVNGQFVGGRAYTAVNGSFTRWGYFTPAYYGRYPWHWFPGKWAIVGTAWTAATWATAGSYCGCEGSGVYYDYEQNVTYEDGNVMYEGEPVATAEEYYQQAETIAETGAETQDEDWLPLGVFAVIAEDDQTKTDKVIQLALNKEGAIRGNYQDMLTDQVTPVTGSVDKESERVALKFEGNDTLVVEIGLYNLTNDEVPALIHFDATRQEPVTLIRLKNPEEQAGQ